MNLMAQSQPETGCSVRPQCTDTASAAFLGLPMYQAVAEASKERLYYTTYSAVSQTPMGQWGQGNCTSLHSLPGVLSHPLHEKKSIIDITHWPSALFDANSSDSTASTSELFVQDSGNVAPTLPTQEQSMIGWLQLLFFYWNISPSHPCFLYSWHRYSYRYRIKNLVHSFKHARANEEASAYLKKQTCYYKDLNCESILRLSILGQDEQFVCLDPF